MLGLKMNISCNITPPELELPPLIILPFGGGLKNSTPGRK